MAEIDLYGGDAHRIRNQYRQSLGRDASDDEVTGWMTGRYAVGGGVDDWLKQIDASHEAQQRRPRTVGTSPGENHTMPAWEQPTAPPTQTPPQPNSGGAGADQIAQWYQQYLQRAPGQEDISKWLSGEYGWGNAGNMSGIQRGIMGSPEARARQTTGGGAGTANPAPYTGFTPRYDYSAFNTAREQKPQASAKDAFAMLSNQAPPPPFHDKRALAAWFNQYIAPGMNSLGHRVLSVSDDGFTYENHEGRFFVDFAQNAGAAPGSMLQRLQWGASPADDATRQRYATAGGAAAASSGPVFGVGAPGGGVPQHQPVSVSSRPQTSGSIGGSAAVMPPFVPVEMPPPGTNQQGLYHQFDANSQQQIAEWYWKYLGRTPGRDDFLAHAGNPGELPGIEQAILQSPEALEYAARQRATPPPVPTTSPTGTTPPPTTTATPPPATPPPYTTNAPSGMPGTQFNDPHTQYLEKILQQMIQARMQPVQDPSRALYEMMLQQRGQALGQAEPQLQKLMAYLEERFSDLQGTGYTGAEGEAIRTGALDPIEQDRQAARKRMMERLSARGLTPDSGIAQQALLEVDKAFDAMRATTQTALTTNDLSRREDRKRRAEGIRTTLADIPQARAREQLDVFGALSQMSQLARQEDEARQREAVGYGGALADLGPQRLQLAMQAAGMGGSPSSMFGNLMQLAQLNQNGAAYGALNQRALMSGIGSIVEMLSRARR